MIANLQNDVTSEVIQNHQFPLLSLCCGLGNCNITMLIYSLVELTIMVYIVSWQITVQLQIIDLIIYITLNKSGYMGAFAFGGFHCLDSRHMDFYSLFWKLLSPSFQLVPDAISEECPHFCKDSDLD